MAKKYKIITCAGTLFLVICILVVSLSASYTSSVAYLLYGDTGDSVMYRVELLDNMYMWTPSTSWGFFHDLEINNYHTYTVNVTLLVDFPELEEGESEVYPLPGEISHVSFHSSDDDVRSGPVYMQDILITQKNSSGVEYADLVTMNFSSRYDTEKEVTELTYSLSFSTADGFIDNLEGNENFLFSLFDMHPEAITMGYGLDFYEIIVTSTYDPEGDAFENTVIDNLGEAVDRLNDVSSLLTNLRNASSTQVKNLEALKTSTETLISQTTELYSKVSDIKNTIDSLPENIGDQFEQKLEEQAQKEYEVAVDGGNELLAQLTEALGGSVDTAGVINSFDGLINVLSYSGRNSNFKIPKLEIPPMEGVSSEPIVLMSATTVNLADYVDMIPEALMTVIQWGAVVGIVVNAVLTLMKFINQFLQGKSVGGEDGD